MIKTYYNKKRFFLKLIDGYIVKTDKEKYPNSIFYFNKEDKFLMQYDIKTECFWLDYTRIWSVFKLKFDLNYQQFNEILIPILEEHFNRKVKTTHNISLQYNNWNNILNAR